MRIVMRYHESDGCTYSCENVIPIEYESCHAAAEDFENSIKSAKEFYFSFAGVEFYDTSFYERGRYCPPEFLTVDEWFAGA